MPMTTAAGQEKIGEKAWFFRSDVSNENKCLIWAHGGHLYGDGTFTLPDGVDLLFLQPEHGKSLTSNPWRTMFDNGKPRATSVERIRAREGVTNYSLGKGVGDHWDAKTTINYEQIRAKMTAQLNVHPNWCPHIVTIRRRYRGLGRLITLRDLVPLIKGMDDHITEIYVGACRGSKLSKGVMGKIKSAFVRI